MEIQRLAGKIVQRAAHFNKIGEFQMKVEKRVIVSHGGKGGGDRMKVLAAVD